MRGKRIRQPLEYNLHRVHLQQHQPCSLRQPQRVRVRSGLCVEPLCALRLPGVRGGAAGGHVRRAPGVRGVYRMPVQQFETPDRVHAVSLGRVPAGDGAAGVLGVSGEQRQFGGCSAAQ